MVRWVNPFQNAGDALWDEAQPELWAGLDEVGRGPLAGPVVAACVVLPPGNLPSCLSDLDDSKRLTESQRNRLAVAVRDVALAYGISLVNHEEIDRINILKATMKAMSEAYSLMNFPVNFALVDGNQIPQLPCPARAVVKGDSTVAAIAAASVLAKVERDRMMVERDAEFPFYGFRWNKGYGSAFHYSALELFGHSPIHRLSFIHEKATAPFYGDREGSLSVLSVLREAQILADLDTALARVKEEWAERPELVFFEEYAKLLRRSS